MDIILYTNKIDEYLKHDEVVDYQNEMIVELADKLFKNAGNELEFIKTAYEFVRDNISHSADINEDVITCTASEVLKAGHGICFAKSHLLTALLRCKAVPAGFCYHQFRMGCYYHIEAVVKNGELLAKDMVPIKKLHMTF